MSAPLQAVIFDMDGVLVDSEPVITAAAIQSLSGYAVNAKQEDFKEFTGMGDDKFIGGVAEKYGVKYDPQMKKKAYEIYYTLVKDMLKVYSGGRALVEKLWETGYIVAIASASDAEKVDANIEAIGVPRDYYTAVITGSDVTLKKPSPDIYIKAAEEISVSPEFCVVIEDAIAGVKAAKAAGMRCIAVTTSFERKELQQAGADVVVDDVFDAGDFLETLI